MDDTHPVTTGVLDLPAPLFGAVDALLAGVLPPLARVALWGVVAGAGSMLLYALISPQARIAHGRRELVERRRQLERYDGELHAAMPLVAGLLRQALGQVGRTAWPALLASLPLLALMAWLSTGYGHRYPDPGSAPAVSVDPSGPAPRWLAPTADTPPRILLADAAAPALLDLWLQAPVTRLHPPRWWNCLLANPAGYLPAQGGIRELRIDLPRRELLAVGPAWMRGWELAFFTALLATSVLVKRLARIA